jgi:3-methyladenine DNA glycosylase AlkD
MEPAELVSVAALAKQIDQRLRGLSRRNAESIRAVRREFSTRLHGAAPHMVFALAQALLVEPQFEYRLMAYELMHYHPTALHRLSARELENLGRGLDSWGAVDTFSIYLAGPLWREGRMPNHRIHGWARSPDRWWRRAALVSTVPLNSKAQGGAGDAYRTLQVCRLLERDRDPLVVKAVSWALRELAKRDPKAVRRFVSERRTVLAPLVVREVANKLTMGRKNPRRKQRVVHKGPAI